MNLIVKPPEGKPRETFRYRSAARLRASRTTSCGFSLCRGVVWLGGGGGFGVSRATCVERRLGRRELLGAAMTLGAAAAMRGIRVLPPHRRRRRRERAWQ